MDVLRCKLFPLIAIWIVIIQTYALSAEQIPVRHIEGVSLGLPNRPKGIPNFSFATLEPSSANNFLVFRVNIRAEPELYSLPSESQ